MSQIGALVSMEGQQWQLCILPIDAARWLPHRSHTSQVGPVHEATSLFAIPLTRPAWSALLSKATTIESSASGRSQHRVAVAGVELSIVRDSVPPASLFGGESIRPLPNNESNLLSGSGSGPTAVVPSSALKRQSPALTANVVFRGTSWSLIIEKGGAAVMQSSLFLSDEAPLNELLPNWLSAIWSVLTAIRFELTSERWRQDNDEIWMKTDEPKWRWPWRGR